MCGIAAIYGAKNSDLDEAERMLERITHRGPDEDGQVEVSGNWLGHRRLSIVDVANGRQPLFTETERGTLYLVGNGEVYNHEALRETLPGAEFRTDSDNEVALHVIARRGIEAVAELRGMFAFVISGEDGFFLAARDPVGIKPLYWARRGDEVRFASEIHAFDEDWQPHVEVFPPGHYWTPDETPEGKLTRFDFAVPRDPKRLHKFDGPSEPGADIPDDMLELVRTKLIQTVNGQMMGDVPVGVFLSGGLDSTLIAAIAQKWYEENRPGEKLQTFAVGLEGSPDLVAARQAAEFIGTDHHESIYTAEDAIDAVPDVVRAIESFDPSLVRSAVPNFILAKFTAKHVKVVLTGEGADEIFAGYEYLRDFTTEEDLHTELVRTIEGLHNLNLQRCDRVTMAHGLEARVPFLELEMIELGLALPAGWKLAGEGQMEKRLLRLAFDGWLPDELLWRVKSQFGDGSGASSVLKERMEKSVTEEEFKGMKDAAEPPLRTREEAAYFRIFSEHLGDVPTSRTVGRFATA
ncbi:asparagine synthase B [Rubrobacter indicoceani]|uniref:asparagine synthase B n=1 Tax=Rubrobacter indicoceani TaxID=2051957 RepID=UPI000E5B5A95|nr:asparagine synthase B [Rubrobacter indicoceani]